MGLTSKKYSFHEEEDAEKIIQNGFTNGIVNTKEAELVAKYLRNKYNLGAVRLERELIKFSFQSDPNFNIITESSSIKRWIKSAMNYNLRGHDTTVITHAEMDVIKTIKDLKHRKVLFACLVLSKALKNNPVNKKATTTSEKYYLHYDNLQSITYILKWDVKESVIADIINIFISSGLIGLLGPERETIQINFVNNAGAVAMEITSPEQAMEWYSGFFGGDTIYCKRCGKETVKKNNKQFVCSECAKEIKNEQKRIWIKNKRKM